MLIPTPLLPQLLYSFWCCCCCCCVSCNWWHCQTSRRLSSYEGTNGPDSYSASGIGSFSPESTERKSWQTSPNYEENGKKLNGATVRFLPVEANGFWVVSGCLGQIKTWPTHTWHVLSWGTVPLYRATASALRLLRIFFWFCMFAAFAGRVCSGLILPLGLWCGPSFFSAFWPV